MIILTKDDNSKKKILESIKKELDFINSSLNMQKNLSTQVLKYFKELATDIDINNDAKNMELYLLKSNKVNDILEKSNKNINAYEIIYQNITSLNDAVLDLTLKEIVEEIDKYNLIYGENNSQILINTTEIETFLKESTPEFQNVIQIKENTNSIEEKLVEISEGIQADERIQHEQEMAQLKLNSNILDPDIVRHRELSENTLIISEQESHVILPYTYKKLNNILKANPDKYTDVYDVIDKIFTKPIKYYRNAPVARFREAYKLAKDRENMSFKGALDLAFECFFNSALHPAIISSCDNLNQLDVYLSCLEYDELEDFYFFDIIYKIPPLKTSKNDMFNF